MFEEISSISEATTAVFAEQKGSASIATICYFYLVASREATYHKEGRTDITTTLQDSSYNLSQNTQVLILSLNKQHTLTPQLHSDLMNSHLSRAVGQCCASVLPEQESDSWTTTLCFPVQKE